MPPESGESLVVPRTARYYVSGAVHSATEHWFALHGYGQLARSFLGECDALRAPHRVVVAPEALSRFYTRGMSEQPGASWMTREAREDEIADQRSYLDLVHERVRARSEADAVHTTVLGFSQGAAAAARWVVQGAVRADRLICWAGGFPVDLPTEMLQSVFSRTRLTFVYGTRDRLISQKQVETMRSHLTDLGLAHDVVQFDGGHRLDALTLSDLAGDSA